METFKLIANATSDIGQREKNQDNLRMSTALPFFNPCAERITASEQFSSDKLHVFCVCDGIGGGESGDIAAKTALEAVESYLNNTDTNSMDLSGILMEAADCANQKVYNLYNSDSPQGGTTIAMIAFRGNDYATFNLGDSPIFMFRNNEIINRSIEHNLAGYKKLQGLPYDEEDSCTLIYFLGRTPEKVSDLGYKTAGTIEENDMFLLCSDGVTNCYKNENLLSEIFLQNESLENTVKKAGNELYADNCTAITIKCVL